MAKFQHLVDAETRRLNAETELRELRDEMQRLRALSDYCQAKLKELNERNKELVTHVRELQEMLMRR